MGLIGVISGKKLICQDFPLCSSVSSVVPVLGFSFIECFFWLLLGCVVFLRGQGF
jgi:hypothetical protein